jgi:tetratricopeptide (TPR) repeat protein
MARRVNRRFVGIFGGIALALVVTILVVWKLGVRQHPEQFVAAAREAEAGNRWQDAVTNWSKAAAAAPQDPAIQTELGSALHILGEQNADVMRRGGDLSAWRRALEINPYYVPALKAEMGYWRDQLRIAPSVDVFQNARDRAQQVMQLAPNDSDAAQTAEFYYVTTVNAWLLGLDTDENLIDDVCKHMRELMAKDPSNPDLPSYLARVSIFRAVNVIRGSIEDTQPTSATRLFKEASDDVTKALVGQDKNAAMHFSAGQIFLVLYSNDRSSPQVRTADKAAAEKEMDLAVKLVKPSEERYVDIIVGAAELAANDGNFTKAHTIVAGLLANMGSDPPTVMRVSRLLRQPQLKDLRPPVEQTLQQALGADAQVSLNQRRYEMLATLTELLISDIGDAATEDAKAPLRPQIQHNLQQMDDSGMDKLRTLSAQAQFDITDKDFIGAIQTLTAGMAGDSRMATNQDLMWYLATAYIGANETEQARDYLAQQVVKQYPDFVEARQKLVALLSSEDTEEARREISQQLSYLKRVDPDDPTVIRMEIMQLDPTQDADRITELYAKLPEKTGDQIEAKAMVALQQLRSGDEAIRLFKVAIANNPGDMQFVEGLARIYASLNRRPEAVAVVERGLQIAPANDDLQLMLKELENAPEAEMLKLKREQEAQISDPVARNVLFATEAMQAGNATDAEKDLKAAAAINPNNPNLLEAYFRFYILTKQWDKIGPYVDKLSQLNKDEAHGLLYQFEWARSQGDTDRALRIATQLTVQLPEFAKSYFCLAQAYQDAGNYEQAINNYDTALRKKGENSQDVEAALMLKSEIDCYYKLNKPQQAEVAIEDGRRHFPGDDDFREMQIKYEDAHGDPEGAAQDLEDLLRLHPDSSSVFLDLAAARMQVASEKLRIGDSAASSEAADAARDLMKDAVVRFPDNYQVYQMLSNILRAENDLPGAEAALKSMEARPLWKKDASPRYLLGQFYFDVNEPEKAAAAYADAMALAKPDELPVIQVRYAAALYAENKIDQALAVLSSANADNPVIRRQRVNLLVQAGRIADAEAELKLIIPANAAEKSELETAWAQLEISARRRDPAMVHLNKALAAEPQNVNALVLRARMKMTQTPSDLDGALVDLNSAHEADPASVDVLLTIADVEDQRLDFEQARKVLATALQVDPTDFKVRSRLAYSYANYQPVELDQSLAVLQDGLNQPDGSTNPELFNDIANVYQQMGKSDMALQTVSAAFQRMPNSFLLVNSFLRLNLDAKQYQTVIDAATSIISQRPELWWAWQFRGQAKARQGNKAAGMSDLIEALSSPAALKDTGTAVSIVEAISHDVDTQKAIDLVKQRLDQADQWKYILILLYHQNNQDANAVQLLEPLLAMNNTLPPSQQLSRLQLAGTIYATAQPKPYADKAYDVYKKLLAINPNDVQALNNFACVCADDFQPPKLEEGLDAIRHAIDISSGAGQSDPLVEDTYGWLLILGGQTPEGMDQVRKAVTRAPMVEGYYHLGEAYLRLDEPEEAQQQVNLALAAIAKAQDTEQPVNQTTRGRVQNLSNRVLESLRLRSSRSSVP